MHKAGRGRGLEANAQGSSFQGIFLSPSSKPPPPPPPSAATSAPRQHPHANHSGAQPGVRVCAGRASSGMRKEGTKGRHSGRKFPAACSASFLIQTRKRLPNGAPYEGQEMG